MNAPFNGKVIMKSPKPNDEGWEIVLVFLGHKGDTPYATWQYAAATDEFVWGHYFETARQAVADYDKRLEQARRAGDR